MPKSLVTEVEISPEMLAIIEALPDAVGGTKKIEFTAQDDDLIFYAYARKKKAALCKIVGLNPYTGKRGCNETTLRHRYLEICKQRGGA